MQWLCEALKAWGIRAVSEGARKEGLRWIRDPHPERFLGSCLAAWERGESVVLGDPGWSDAVVAEAESVAGAFLASAQGRILTRGADGPGILIPTGGSSGRLRFVLHTEATLRAAAAGYREAFGASAAAAWNVLPLHHVGGLMTVVRAAHAGVGWGHGSYRELSSRLPPTRLRGALSLVPTQLHRLLGDPRARDHLRSFGRIFVGGASLAPADAAKAREARLPLAPCYGMSETAAMVTALTPERFLAGDDGCGTPLPHVRLSFGQGCGTAEDPGRIRLATPSLALGRWPGGPFARGEFDAADAGYFDNAGSLRVCGRLDRILVTGGENVDPERIEAALRQALPGAAEIHVAGMPDADWGQRVVAFVAGPEGVLPQLSLPSLRAAEKPKDIVWLRRLPRTEAGKVDFVALRREWQARTSASGSG